MKWSGAIKAKQVEIPEDLHAAVKAKAVGMGIRTVDGYVDALERWVAADVDLEELMDRVDLWERQRIFEMAEQENGSYWWFPLMLTCIYDAWRRKVGEAMARGSALRVLTTTGLSLEALGATMLLVIRQIFFPLAPIGLQPLRTVLAYTA